MEQDGGPNTIELEEGSEWRFELENDENIAVRVSVCIQFVGPSRGHVDIHNYCYQGTSSGHSYGHS